MIKRIGMAPEGLDTPFVSGEKTQKGALPAGMTGYEGGQSKDVSDGAEREEGGHESASSGCTGRRIDCVNRVGVLETVCREEWMNPKGYDHGRA